jgi:hypothetical protein
VLARRGAPVAEPASVGVLLGVARGLHDGLGPAPPEDERRRTARLLTRLIHQVGAPQQLREKGGGQGSHTTIGAPTPGIGQQAPSVGHSEASSCQHELGGLVIKRRE